MIYYSTNGNYKSEKLLVCIHGLATNHSMFSDFIPELNKLDLFIISPDLRGCGQSIKIDGEFSINEAAEDIKEILDLYKNRKVVLLGYSQGGTVAQLFARKFPDRVSGLILCNTFANNTVTLKELFETYVAKFFLQIFNLTAFSNLIAKEFKKDKQISDIKIEDFKQMIRTNKKKAIISYVKHLIKFDSRPWLNKIHQPCLIIRGQNDTAVPLHHTNMLSNSIPNSKTFFIENAGHGMIWSHTKQLAKIVCDNYFLLN
jgi:3-oxoadipate enol-lactonase